MKKALAIKIMVDPKNIRRTVALILGENITDEEMNEQFFDRDPVTINPPEDQEFEITAGLAALMIAQDLEDNEGKPEPKSRFSKKLWDAQQAAEGK